MHHKVSLFLLLNFHICLYHSSNSSHSIDVNVVDFTVDDIFGNEIPVQLVHDQLNSMFNKNYSDNEKMSMKSQRWMCFNTSDLSTAVSAMRYHRQMMNEYLLSGYLLKEIVGSIRNTTTYSKPLIEKRFGKAKNKTIVDKSNVANNTNQLLPTNHKLIDDEGSSQYFSWLKRMSTFEDIQNQLSNKKPQHSDQTRKLLVNRRQSLNINMEPTYEDNNADDGLEYLDDGDITGYAFTNTPTEYIAPINLYKNHQKSQIEGKSKDLQKQAINKAGYENSYDDYTATSHSNIPSPTSSKNKEIGLKDITDIALTTLAFLSFGMFILQVLMCITMSKDDTSNMVMMPMEGTDNGDLTGDDNTMEIRRKRRSIFTTQMHNIESIDELAKRALFSLNAVSSMTKDEGSCHYYSLCENNKFARRLQDTKKLWIPVWSIGISWLTMKFNALNKTSTTSNGNAIMQSLKAIILGLNNGYCATHYINKCKLIYN